MPDYKLFSPESNGSFNYELGSYALNPDEMRKGTRFKLLFKVQEIGEFEVPREIVEALDSYSEARQVTADDRAKIVLKLMLERASQLG